MLKINKHNNPVINLHIEDPLVLSEHYYKMIDDDFKYFVCSSLQDQYHLVYYNPYLSNEEKFPQLSLLSSCIYNIESSAQKAALSAAGVFVNPYQHFEHESLGVILDKVKNAAGAAGRGAMWVINGAQSAAVSMAKVVNYKVEISKLESQIKQDLQNLIRTFPTAVKNIDGLHKYIDSLESNMDHLYQLKTGQSSSGSSKP